MALPVITRPLLNAAALPTLLCEFTHRVVNEYAEVVLLLSIAAGKAVDDHSRTALLVAVGRMQTFAHAHSVLRVPKATDEIDACVYLRETATALVTSRADLKGFQVAMSFSSCPLDALRAWYLALIMTELINNAIRHGLTQEHGPVAVTLQRQGDFGTLTVRNATTCANPPRVGTGCSVVKELAQSLGAFVTWRFGHGSMTATVTFPLRPCSVAPAKKRDVELFAIEADLNQR